METITRIPPVALQTWQLKHRADRERAAAPAAAPVVAAIVPQPERVRAVPDDAHAQPAVSREQARLEIERELAHARAQAEQEWAIVRASAEREGYAAGLAQGQEDARHTVAEQAARLQSAADALLRAQTDVIGNAEDLIVEIAYTAVCRIAGPAAVAPAAVADMAGQLLQACRERERLVVRLNPQDLDLVRRACDPAAFGQQVALRADASILAGCVVESDGGNLDARLETQLARLRETLLAVRRGQGEGAT